MPVAPTRSTRRCTASSTTRAGTLLMTAFPKLVGSRARRAGAPDPHGRRDPRRLQHADRLPARGRQAAPVQGAPRDRRDRRAGAGGDAVRHRAVPEGPRPLDAAPRPVPVRARVARHDRPHRRGRLPRRRRGGAPGQHGAAAPEDLQDRRPGRAARGGARRLTTSTHPAAARVAAAGARGLRALEAPQGARRRAIPWAPPAAAPSRAPPSAAAAAARRPERVAQRRLGGAADALPAPAVGHGARPRSAAPPRRRRRAARGSHRRRRRPRGAPRPSRR